jgi:hypothetical protein
MIKLVNSAIFTALLGLCQSSLGMEQKLKPDRPEAVIDYRGTTVHEQMQIFRDAIAIAAAAPTGAAAAGAGATVAPSAPTIRPVETPVRGAAHSILTGPVGWMVLQSRPELRALIETKEQN